MKLAEAVPIGAGLSSLLDNAKKYCKLGIFCENFIFANSVKRHICNDKILRLRHDLPISVNDRVISPFGRGFL